MVRKVHEDAAIFLHTLAPLVGFTVASVPAGSTAGIERRTVPNSVIFFLSTGRVLANKGSRAERGFDMTFVGWVVDRKAHPAPGNVVHVLAEIAEGRVVGEEETVGEVIDPALSSAGADLEGGDFGLPK